MEDKLLIIADVIQIEETLFFRRSISRSFVSSNYGMCTSVCSCNLVLSYNQASPSHGLNLEASTFHFITGHGMLSATD